MTLEQLRIFVAVAEREHVTRAAQALNLTQSATSAAVAALEARYQTRLFDRVGRGIVLTEAGRIFLAEARAVLARASAAEAVLADLAGLRVGKLRIAGSQTVANYWLPFPLTAFHERYPGVTIDLWVGNSDEVEKRVVRGQVDVGIAEQEPSDGTLLVETLASDTLIGVVGRRHPWFGREQVDWHELPQSPWIMREPGSGTRALFETMLVRQGIPPESLDVVLVLRTGEAVRNAVVAGSCAAVMSTLVADVAVRTGALHCLRSISITRRFVALSLPARAATRTTAALLDHLRASGDSIGAAKVGRPALQLIAKTDSSDRSAK